MISNKQQKKARRHNRIRVKVNGRVERPRLLVARSLKHIQVQLIDDVQGKTLVAANDQEIKVDKQTKTEVSFAVGKLIAQKALEKKITEVVFDRGGDKYHGRVKAVAEGARAGGLKF